MTRAQCRKGQTGVAGLPPYPQLVVRQDRFGADARPVRQRAEDEVDVDVAGDVDRAGLLTSVHRLALCVETRQSNWNRKDAKAQRSRTVQLRNRSTSPP